MLKSASLIEKQIIIDDFPTKFESSILQKSIENLVDYKGSDEVLIKLLIFYLNHIEDLNYQLKFTSANKTISTLNNDDSIEQGIHDYFNSIKTEYLEKIKNEILICEKLITQEKNK